MVIVNQNKDGTTNSLNFQIKERQTCKSELVSKEIWEKFKRITQKGNNIIGVRELKGLEELVGKKLTENIYVIVEVNSNRIFGYFTTKKKAIKELQRMLKNLKEEVYQIQDDKEKKITMYA